jgi:hypothetical protein
VLIQHVRVRLGPGGSWDPNTGMITSAMNTTRMTAAILATTNGQVLWRNQVHLREVPRVQDSSYRDAVGRLFPKASPSPFQMIRNPSMRTIQRLLALASTVFTWSSFPAAPRPHNLSTTAPSGARRMSIPSPSFRCSICVRTK